jgi:4'-phosphopantetheinyl transferase
MTTPTTSKKNVLWTSAAPKNIHLGPTDLHVWQANIEITSTQAQAIYPLLSPTEKDRAENFKFDTHRLKFIAARANLRKILSYYLLMRPESICFTENQYGKPMLDSTQHPSGIFFNLSHAHKIALYAISPVENIGIDIEFMDRKVDFDGIATRFFSKKESQHIQSITAIEKKTRDFFKIWTAKEAFIKAVGRGLSFPLKEFDISFKKGKVFLAHIDGDTYQARDWVLFPLEVPSDYQACVCIQSEMPELNTITFSDNNCDA